MMRCAIVTSVMATVLVNDARPPVIVISPGTMVVLTTTGQTHVVAPSWMCAMLIVDPAGNPPTVTAKTALAAVMLPAPSFVTLSVMLAVPVTPTSPLVTGGTSLAGDSDAEKTGLAAAVGDVVVEDELPQPAAKSARARARTDKRFIVRLSFWLISRTSATD